MLQLGRGFDYDGNPSLLFRSDLDSFSETQDEFHELNYLPTRQSLENYQRDARGNLLNVCCICGLFFKSVFGAGGLQRHYPTHSRNESGNGYHDPESELWETALFRYRTYDLQDWFDLQKQSKKEREERRRLSGRLAQQRYKERQKLKTKQNISSTSSEEESDTTTTATTTTSSSDDSISTD